MSKTKLQMPFCAGLQVGKDVMHFRPPDEQNDHKVTCGVNVSVLQPVLDHIQKALDAAGLQLNIITSGTGNGDMKTSCVW